MLTPTYVTARTRICPGARHDQTHPTQRSSVGIGEDAALTGCDACAVIAFDSFRRSGPSHSNGTANAVANR
jgi:hypothetical protein